MDEVTMKFKCTVVLQAKEDTSRVVQGAVEFGS